MSTLDSNSRTPGSGANDDKESRVYRITSLVFAARGVAAPITAKTLRRAIDGVKDQIEVATLLSCYSEAEVDRVAERLRSEGAFDCRDKARDRCPQPFNFVREIERQRGKAKKWRRRQARARSREHLKEYRASLAKGEAAVPCTPQAVEGIGSSHQISEYLQSVLPAKAPQILPAQGPQICPAHEFQALPAQVPLISPARLPTMCLPLDAQLKILAHLRCILQEMFRKFADENSLLADPDSIWGSGDVDDLHKWWQKSQEDARSDSHDKTEATRTLEQLSLSVSGTHLILVHKVVIPARTLTKFITDAVTIARMMGAEPYASVLSRFRDSAKAIADELDMRCDALHSMMKQQLSGAESSATYSSVVSQRSQVLNDYKRRIEQQREASAERVGTMLSLADLKCR